MLAYLIHRQKWRLAHAHAWLRERRPSVALQPAAAEQLAAYELAVLGDVARDPPPPTPAHNPLPRNDAPFGVPPERQAPVGGPAPLLHHGGGGAGAAAGAGAGAAASMPFGSPLALGEAALPPQHHGWMGPG